MNKPRKKYGFEPDYAVPPGETLKETMESLSMSQKELSVRTGLTVQSLNRIFKGEQPLTYETANRLELATGVPARFWNSLEARYREQLAKIAERERLKEDLEWLRQIPVRELVERGVVPDRDDKVAQLREVLGFYGVSSVSAWREIWEKPALAARRSVCFETLAGPASAWIRQGEIQARKIQCRPYNKSAFRHAVGEIRKLTVGTPDLFVPAMTQLCADAGVALVLVREMKKVPWFGATKWLSSDKAMILLNLRLKTEDHFWFSFFLEAGHVLNDGKKHVFINDGKKNDPKEISADEFAAGILVPKEREEEARMLSKSSTIGIPFRF